MKDVFAVLAVAAILVAGMALAFAILFAIVIAVKGGPRDLLALIMYGLGRRGKVTIPGPSVLLLDLSTGRDSELAKQDRDIYGAGFGAVSQSTGLESLERGGVVIVHVFVRADAGGLLAGMTPEAFFKAMEAAQPSLVIVASENEPGFAKGVRHPYNLVLTWERRGNSFGEHLRKLYALMFSGKTLIQAWISLSPQNPNLPDDGSEPLLMCVPSFPNVSFKAAK